MALVLQFGRNLRCRSLLSKEELFMEENCIVVENLSKSVYPIVNLTLD